MLEFIDEKGIIEPSETSEKAKRAVAEFGATTAVAAFSNHIFDAMVKGYGGVKVAAVTGGCDNDLYGITYGGKNIIVYKSPIGAPAAVMAAEEALACGIQNLITFGICGALTEVPVRTFIVPTFALRDEGTSFHYAPAGERIELVNGDRVAAALARYGMKAITGGAWCTDALYRETRTAFNRMVERGCVAVDMECSALQAMCDYRKKNFYTFFITADSLAGKEWEPNYILDIALSSLDEVGAAGAIRLASEL